ncbi:hypothetical protein [Burkholderia sp. Bp9004]|uniref:hypothetical protein n=1 Tax=Burkholderia sp. Bp9004 TaxID=2184559 RepID=UPI00163A86DA|nr:hypothetical protein [Burkholderia sp. Bp9004]
MDVDGHTNAKRSCCCGFGDVCGFMIASRLVARLICVNGQTGHRLPARLCRQPAFD